MRLWQFEVMVVGEEVNASISSAKAEAGFV
jgi:hypothetical protein